MHRFVFAVAAAVLFLASGCASGAALGALPPRAGAPADADLTLVWVGYGACEQLAGGAWVRRPEFDYEFTVEQRRNRDQWESVKHMRRRHPGYDGSAGPREQTLFFRVALGASTEGKVPLQIASTLGAGEGHADREFRQAQLVLHPEQSRWAPFDTYRIDQRYGYERGVLEETVHLDLGSQPWVRNLEQATLFAAHAYPAPPTTR